MYVYVYARARVCMCVNKKGSWERIERTFKRTGESGLTWVLTTTSGPLTRLLSLRRGRRKGVKSEGFLHRRVDQIVELRTASREVKIQFGYVLVKLGELAFELNFGFGDQ